MRCLSTILLAVLASLALGCGSDGDGGTSGPTPTPAPTPTPVVTPTPVPVTLAPMALAASGRVNGVNAREWIPVVQRHSLGFVEDGVIVLPPDAGPDAGPIPVPGCPLSPPDPACVADGYPVAVGETDWIFGQGMRTTPSGFEVSAQNAYGPAGEIAQIFFADAEIANSLRIGPGPLFSFIQDFGVTQGLAPRAYRLDATDYTNLPREGFADGPQPWQSDARMRIVGGGIEPQLPVLWVPDGESWRLERLPLLDGGTRGGALGIDGDVIAGWSSDAGGAAKAVAWTESDGAWTPALLPLPEGVTRCGRAVGVSGDWIAGECTVAGGRVLGAVWQRDGDRWGFRATLTGLADGAEVRVVGISEDLVVGDSVRGQDESPVAWRLPDVSKGEP